MTCEHSNDKKGQHVKTHSQTRKHFVSVTAAMMGKNRKQKNNWKPKKINIKAVGQEMEYSIPSKSECLYWQSCKFSPAKAEPLWRLFAQKEQNEYVIKIIKMIRNHQSYQWASSELSMELSPKLVRRNINQRRNNNRWRNLKHFPNEQIVTDESIYICKA